MRCACPAPSHDPRFVCVTGGPGAGKTALLEVIRRDFCEHVVVLPEAASILFGGGFPRLDDEPARRGAQRAIFAVQTQLERIARERRAAAVVLCDRGTLDGLAYWPGSPADFFADTGTTLERELAHYAAVLHLRTPDRARYNHVNPVRIEDAAQARVLDEKIAAVWSAHPSRTFIASTDEFLTKLAAAVAFIRKQVPACCLR